MLKNFQHKTFDSPCLKMSHCNFIKPNAVFRGLKQDKAYKLAGLYIIIRWQLSEFLN